MSKPTLTPSPKYNYIHIYVFIFFHVYIEYGYLSTTSNQFIIYEEENQLAFSKVHGNRFFSNKVMVKFPSRGETKI